VEGAGLVDRGRGRRPAHGEQEGLRAGVGGIALGPEVIGADQWLDTEDMGRFYALQIGFDTIGPVLDGTPETSAGARRPATGPSGRRGSGSLGKRPGSSLRDPKPALYSAVRISRRGDVSPGRVLSEESPRQERRGGL
jgi:hypothetical protein